MHLGLRLRLMLTLTALAILPLAVVSYVVARDEIGNVKTGIRFERRDSQLAARARLTQQLDRRELDALAAASALGSRPSDLRAFARRHHVVLDVHGRSYGTPIENALSAKVQLVSREHPLGTMTVQVPRGRTVGSFSHLQAQRIGAVYRRVEEAAALALVALMLLTFVLARPLLRALRWTEQRAEESRVDPLTGIANRRAFEETLEAEISRARRFQHALAVVILDLDHFKRTNDAYGHGAGDLLLREVGRLLTATARQGDTVARLGGEEFVAILPETDLDGALHLAERLRVEIEASRIATMRSTASFGVAALMDEDTAATLVAAADEALYRAKENGRNRTESAAPRPSSAAA